MLCCFFVYESLKRGNKKRKRWDKKKLKNEKELRGLLWNAVVNNVYRSWVALVSSVFPNAINNLILKNFPGRVIYFS